MFKPYYINPIISVSSALRLIPTRSLPLLRSLLRLILFCITAIFQMLLRRHLKKILSFWTAYQIKYSLGKAVHLRRKGRGVWKMHSSLLDLRSDVLSRWTLWANRNQVGGTVVSFGVQRISRSCWLLTSRHQSSASVFYGVFIYLLIDLINYCLVHKYN